MSIGNVNPAFTDEGTYSPDNLIAGDHPLETRTVTILSGQNLTRGALLGKVTASGKFILSLAAAGDGSQTPKAILLQDTDASGGDTEAPIAVAGEFNERAVTFGTGHTADSVREGLEALSIYLKPSVAAG